MFRNLIPRAGRPLPRHRTGPPRLRLLRRTRRSTSSTTPSTPSPTSPTRPARPTRRDAVRDLRPGLRRPGRLAPGVAPSASAITAIITQNGNGYDAGFVATDSGRRSGTTSGPDARDRGGAPRRPDHRHDQLAVPDGVPDQSLVSPDTWQHDFALLSRPGNDEIQLKLFRDYATNPPLYPRCTSTCAPARSRCWRCGATTTRSSAPTAPAPSPRTLPDAEIHLLDGGHFLLESRGAEVTALILDFLSRRL